MVGVAQLVERWIVIPVVVGSIPIVHPIFELSNRLTFCLNGLLVLYSYIGPWQSFLLIQKTFYLRVFILAADIILAAKNFTVCLGLR